MVEDSVKKKRIDNIKYIYYSKPSVQKAIFEFCKNREIAPSYMMEGFGSVPIVDENNKLVGIVSEFDLLAALRKGKKLQDVAAGEILTANPVSVTKDTDIVTLMDVLQNNHLIRVPVLDNVGKLIGIVARRDLLRGYLQTSGSF